MNNDVHIEENQLRQGDEHDVKAAQWLTNLPATYRWRYAPPGTPPIVGFSTARKINIPVLRRSGLGMVVLSADEPLYATAHAAKTSKSAGRELREAIKRITS